MPVKTIHPEQKSPNHPLKQGMAKIPARSKLAQAIADSEKSKLGIKQCKGFCAL
jgi:hypothetical protein